MAPVGRAVQRDENELQSEKSDEMHKFANEPIRSAAG
jgi:hypothetical protein